MDHDKGCRDLFKTLAVVKPKKLANELKTVRRSYIDVHAQGVGLEPTQHNTTNNKQQTTNNKQQTTNNNHEN